MTSLEGWGSTIELRPRGGERGAGSGEHVCRFTLFAPRSYVAQSGREDLNLRPHGPKPRTNVLISMLLVCDFERTVSIPVDGALDLQRISFPPDRLSRTKQ